MATDNQLLSLNKALGVFQFGKEVDDVDISVKKAGAKSVTYTVKSSDRETTRNNVEGSLKKFNVGTISRKQMSISSMAVTQCQMSDVKLMFVYKPTKGGMSQTTLNSSITELFPCIAFITGIRSNSVRGVQDFYNKVRNANNSSLPCYLGNDAKAGKEFIDKAEQGKFNEKVQNAINILKWIEGVNKFHPIAMVYWGYRKKPKGVMSNHPGDIFLQFENGKMLGVSLKAGGEKTDEPKLNTYVRPIYEFYGKLNEYEKLKNLLWPQYMQIPGMTESDKRHWGKTSLALKTYEFEKDDEDKYNELYDINLEIIKTQLINLLNSDFNKTRLWLMEKVAQQQKDVPVVVVKATDRTARRDKATDILIESLASVKTIAAGQSKKKSKQAWNINLRDGSALELDFTTRTNKVGAAHKLGQFSNLAVKFNKVKKV
tara:strand:+ start:1859 stop:3145 length:1287 start_codon:yes stop_codon:yes gene_type:complete